MKKLIAGIVAGAVLASAGTASAYARYWQGSGAAYSCQGIPSGVTCKSKVGGRYQVMIEKSGVTVFTAGNQARFTCKWTCEDFYPGE
jgi:hypothetical protein